MEEAQQDSPQEPQEPNIGQAYHEWLQNGTPGPQPPQGANDPVLNAIVQRTSQWQAPTGQQNTLNTKEAWQKLAALTVDLEQPATATAPTPQAKQRTLWPILLRVAAALVLVSGLAWLLVPSFTNSSGQQLSVVTTAAMQDSLQLNTAGSKAFVNANSTLETVVASAQPNTGSAASQPPQEVYLKGEAFFDIVPNQGGLLVRTDYGTVTVLGTRFNVLARNGRFAVSCQEGSVQVQSNENPKPRVLKAGQGVEYLKGQPARTDLAMEPAFVGAWIKGIFYFHDATLHQVFAEMERQYNIKVQLPPTLENRRYSGSFRNNNLEAALQTVCAPMGLRFENTGNNAYLITQ